MYRVAYMYVPPPPPRRTRSCLVPPGCQRVKATKRHRRQPVEGRRESTDQVTALTASDQYTEGNLSSTQEVCIVTYVVKYANYLHSYLCKRLLVSSCQVCKRYALLVTYQVRNVIALLVTYQVCNVIALLVSCQVCNVIALLVTYQVCKMVA